MNAALEAESTLTDRYQTTVPETVRRALKLGKRDKLQYPIRPDGKAIFWAAIISTGSAPNSFSNIGCFSATTWKVKSSCTLGLVETSTIVIASVLMKAQAGQGRLDQLGEKTNPYFEAGTPEACEPKKLVTAGLT